MSLEAEVEFCLKFLKEVDADKKCTIYSPASVLNSLAIIYAGSDKNTADEIAKVIGKYADIDKILNYYSELCCQFKSNTSDILQETLSPPTPEKFEETDEEEKCDSEKSNSSSNESDEQECDEEEEDSSDLEDTTSPLFKVINTNGLFVDNKINLIPKFESLIIDKFFVQVQKVDFNDNEKAAEVINNYIYNSTNGKINDIIESHSLATNTSCVLVNAIYFIGKWYNSFKPRFKAVFHSTPSSTKEIEFMSEDLHQLNYTEGKTWKSCGIPYKGHKYWMFFVLPKDESNLEELIASMDYLMFQQWTASKPAALNLTIPLFEISNSFDLSQTLPALGIQDLFCHEKCNLSQMFSSPHIIDKSVHKAMIKVNEYGTEASAATYSSMCPRSARTLDKFIANHPFLYFIVSMDDESSDGPVKNILFSGTYL